MQFPSAYKLGPGRMRKRQLVYENDWRKWQEPLPDLPKPTFIPKVILRKATRGTGNNHLARVEKTPRGRRKPRGTRGDRGKPA